MLLDRLKLDVPEPDIQIQISDDGDGTPLVCGDCNEPIRVEGGIQGGIDTAECGCDEFPFNYTFTPMDE